MENIQEIHTIQNIRLEPLTTSENNVYIAQDSEYTIINKTGRNFYALCISQAGSGDINTSLTGIQDTMAGNELHKIQKSKPGNNGTDIQVFLDNVLYDVIVGGSGSMAGVIALNQKHSPAIANTGSGKLEQVGWNHYATITSDSYKIAREGQIKIIPFLFKKDSTIKLTFTTHNAKTAMKEQQGYVEIIPCMYPFSMQNTDNIDKSKEIYYQDLPFTKKFILNQEFFTLSIDAQKHIYNTLTALNAMLTFMHLGYNQAQDKEEYIQNLRTQEITTSYDTLLQAQIQADKLAISSDTCLPFYVLAHSNKRNMYVEKTQDGFSIKKSFFENENTIVTTVDEVIQLCLDNYQDYFILCKELRLF